MMETQQPSNYEESVLAMERLYGIRKDNKMVPEYQDQEEKKEKNLLDSIKTPVKHAHSPRRQIRRTVSPLMKKIASEVMVEGRKEFSPKKLFQDNSTHQSMLEDNSIMDVSQRSGYYTGRKSMLNTSIDSTASLYSTCSTKSYLTNVTNVSSRSYLPDSARKSYHERTYQLTKEKKKKIRKKEH